MGITQAELVSATGLSSKSTISGIETGAYFPEIENLIKNAEVLNASVDDLMTDDLSTQNELFENINDSLFEIFEKLPALDEKHLTEFSKIIEAFKKIIEYDI